MDHELITICRLTDELRERTALSRERPFSAADRRLLRERLSAFGSRPVVRAFLLDAERAADGPPDFSLTRDVTAEADSGLVLGLFAAPYNGAFGLDALAFEELRPDPRLADRYPSPSARAIRVVDRTAGFRAPGCVALFPENYVAGWAIRPEHRVYYFIDRFVERHERITRPVLGRYTTPASFARVKQADAGSITAACATWVLLHEHFHHRGYMPLPDYLPRKSGRSSAAVEEVRVDSLAIIACLDEWDRGSEDGRLYAELILAERLLRYPLQDHPQTSYDSRGSQLLFRHLAGRGLIREAGARIAVGLDGLAVALKELVIYINKLESQHCRSEGPGNRPVPGPGELVRRYGGFDEATGRFEYLPFFRRVRDEAREGGMLLG